ncbi:enoyl-CoA hydratase/isomerase family protein [Amycolatopsis acidicola]|uniref:Enoyl-CoA hydratase/isomerase family protein n=1 Tax=Amycolatopsis acidicola TaxID=2596893 RepID=A0A5N0VFD2_9PSEU|nr:enoyl-CoA hydratase-related protein [Amycolatopsis acidicola]KAA9164083.1 enoyl-CoA hydratase/isomerase family protein [Amycolatopsis acidicola]
MVHARLDGAVFTITLNRPDRLNAVTAELFEQLSGRLTEAAASDASCVVLTGAGRGFCSGADLRAPRPALEPGSRRLRELYHPAIAQIGKLGKPVIAAVNGAAVGAGVSLAAAADIRVVSSTARFIPGFADIGLAPDNGGSWNLSRILGYHRAFHWLTLGYPLSAERALEWGLADEVVTDAELMDRVSEIAATLAAKPGCAVEATKRLLRAAPAQSLSDQLEMEAEMCDLTTSHPERIAARAARTAKMS